MSFLKPSCLIATSMTLGAVIGYMVFGVHGLPQWYGGIVGGTLGVVAAMAAARSLEWIAERNDESVSPYG